MWRRRRALLPLRLANGAFILCVLPTPWCTVLHRCAVTTSWRKTLGETSFIAFFEYCKGEYRLKWARELQRPHCVLNNYRLCIIFVYNTCLFIALCQHYRVFIPNFTNYKVYRYAENLWHWLGNYSAFFRKLCSCREM